MRPDATVTWQYIISPGGVRGYEVLPPCGAWVTKATCFLPEPSEANDGQSTHRQSDGGQRQGFSSGEVSQQDEQVCEWRLT